MFNLDWRGGAKPGEGWEYEKEGRVRASGILYAAQPGRPNWHWRESCMAAEEAIFSVPLVVSWNRENARWGWILAVVVNFSGFSRHWLYVAFWALLNGNLVPRVDSERTRQDLHKQGRWVTAMGAGACLNKPSSLSWLSLST